MDFELRPTAPAHLSRRIDALLGALEGPPGLADAERLRPCAQRAAALAREQDWFAASSALLEAAELERRANGARGDWWALWLEVHDALIAGELGDWSEG